MKQNKHILYIAIGTLTILLIPAIGMQVSDNWQWTAFDFIIAGVVLFGAGLAFELISRRSDSLYYKAAVAFVIFTILALLWVNGAVGIFGGE